MSQRDQALGKAFQGLQDDVADKAVADHDVNAVVKEVVALDVADEIQVRHFAKFAGFQGQFGAFVRLGAVAEDAHARVFVSENLARVNAAHDGKMEQVAWAAFHAGARVQQDEFILRRRE